MCFFQVRQKAENRALAQAPCEFLINELYSFNEKRQSFNPPPRHPMSGTFLLGGQFWAIFLNVFWRPGFREVFRWIWGVFSIGFRKFFHPFLRVSFQKLKIENCVFA